MSYSDAPSPGPAAGDDPVLRSATALRWAIMASIPFAVAATIVLSLSDRVPGVFRSAAIRLHVPVRLRDGVAGIDPFHVLHFLGWAALAFACVVAVGRMRWAPLIAAVLVSASVVIEFVQQTTTDIRAYEASDVVANGLGVVLGSVAALAVLAALAHRRRELDASGLVST